MSSYHILKSQLQGTDIRTSVEYHITVPNETNTLTGEVNYLQSRLSGDNDIVKLSGDPNIAPSEQADINQGEVYLVNKTIKLHKDEPFNVRQQKIRDLFALVEVEALESLRIRYAFESITETEGVDF